MRKSTGGRALPEIGAKEQVNFSMTSQQQLDSYAKFSNRAKTDLKSRETMMIGKPAGKKNYDDRENINQMRQLLSQTPNKDFGADSKNDLRLEFSQSTIVEYTQHNKCPTGVMYNQNAGCFASYNEKGIHVWNPKNGRRIFEAIFELGMTQDLSKPKNFNEASRTISCVCYSKKYFLYFACTKNFKLLVFNEYLNCVREMPLNIRLVQQCIFVDETQQLITAGVQGCFVVQLKLHYTYEPKKAIKLNPKGDSIRVDLVEVDNDYTYRGYYKFQRIGKWVKGMTLDLRQQFFVCWTDTSTYFYKFVTTHDTEQNVVAPTVYENLVQGIRARTVTIDHEKLDNSSEEEEDDAYLKNMQPRSDADTITDILLYNPMHYFIVSTTLGQILVFKWDYRPLNTQNTAASGDNFSQSQNEVKKADKPQLMHTFKGHSRAVTSMRLIKRSVKSSDPSEIYDSSFVSASLDGTIRIWCLDKFIQLHHFQTKGCSLGTKMTDIQMLDDRVFAIMSKGPNLVTVGQISHLAKSYFISTPLVTALSKGFTTMDLLAENDTEYLITTFNNNSVLLLDPETGAIKSTIYPPPTPTNIQQTLYSMMLKRVFVFLQSGTFCVYKVDGRETATLEKLQPPKQLKDYEKKPLTQTITALMLCSLTPPATDNEIFGDKQYDPLASQSKPVQAPQDETEDHVSASSTSMREDSEDAVPSEHSEQFLVMGLSKGSVVFVKVNHIEHIYARFSIHKQQIEHIHELKRQKCIMTICSENELKIWGFQDGKLAIYRKWFLFRPVAAMKVIEDPVHHIMSQTHILLTFQSGEAHFLQWHKRPGHTIDLESKKPTGLNLRVVLPPEEEKWYAEGQEQSEQEDKDRDKTEEELKIKLAEHLEKGTLVNGQLEHDEKVTCIDYHCYLKLIATGDAGGLIKIWNYRRMLVREIKFTEPISAMQFLNRKGDLIVGHKGKLSKIKAEDYFPYPEFIEVPSPENYGKVLRNNSAPIPDNFFTLIKNQSDEVEALNDRLRKPKPQEEESEQNSALMTHLNNLFKVTPKFGMPMDEFKALLNKDDRVPKLTDKRTIVQAFQQKLAVQRAAAEISKEVFQPEVFKQALNEAIREQERVTKVQPKGKAAAYNTSPIQAAATRGNNKYATRADTQTDVINSEKKKEILPWRQNMKQNKNPATTNAIPLQVGPSRPNHPKVGQLRHSAKGMGASGKTRYQLTQERIMDNIKFFNNPNPSPSLNILMVGQQLEQQSVYSERRPISRKAYRSKGTMSNVDGGTDKAASEAPGKAQMMMMSASAYHFPSSSGVVNVFSSDQLKKNYAYGGAAAIRHQRKNLASANIYVRRGEAAGAFSSVTDSMSQPDFSIGAGANQEANSSTGGPGTAAGTDSVRPLSQPGLSKFQSARGGVKSIRPGTVGTKAGRLFHRSDIMQMRGSLQNSAQVQGIADDFMITEDPKKIKVSLQGRNKMMNTASAEHNIALPGPLINMKGPISVAQSSPAKGFPPAKPLKKNIQMRQMKSQRNAAIASSISRGSKGPAPMVDMPYTAMNQRGTEMILIDTQHLPPDTQYGSLHEKTAKSQKVGTELNATGVPAQVVEMNENVRELVITPSMQKSNQNTSLKQTGLPTDNDKNASALSNLTKVTKLHESEK